ncbi:hypothetical protein VO54_01451 [Elizabethkingia miricola]|nr:hypothetical protein VO54_01451 [Elizabethkingia miricola]
MKPIHIENYLLPWPLINKKELDFSMKLFKKIGSFNEYVGLPKPLDEDIDIGYIIMFRHSG